MSRVAVFGSITIEFTYTVDKWPEQGNSLQARARVGYGGKGLFQAVASHRMDAQTTLISSMGDDMVGRDVLNLLKMHNVEPCIEFHTPRNGHLFCTDTATVIRESKSGKNATLAYRESTERMTAAFVDDNVRSVIAQADTVLVTFDVSTQRIEQVIQIAAELKKPVIVNASPPADVPLDILQSVRYLVVTAKEAKTWLRNRTIRTEEELQAYSDVEVAALLFAQGPQGVILTLDPYQSHTEEQHQEQIATPQQAGHGCWVLDRSHRNIARRYGSYERGDTVPVGARSLFCAGVLVACSETAENNAENTEKETEAKVIEFASAAKSWAAAAAGHFDSLPHRDAVEQVMWDHRDQPLLVEEIAVPMVPIAPPIQKPDKKRAKPDGTHVIG